MTDISRRLAEAEARLAEVEEHIAGLTEELDNLSGLERGHHLDMLAVEAAILAIVAALDDKLPAARDVIALDLDERLHKAFDNHPSITSGDFEPPSRLLWHIMFPR